MGLHTGTRELTLDARFTVWDLPGRLVVTDPWQMRAAREAVAAVLSARIDAVPEAGVARPFPYGVQHAVGPVHHDVPAGPRLDTGRRRIRPPTHAVQRATALQRAADAAAEATSCGVLVAAGAQLAVSGLAPAGGWRLRLPGADGVIALDGGALTVLGTTGGAPLRPLVVATTGRSVTPVWRRAAVLAADAGAATAAAWGALVRGRGAAAWLDSAGLAARLVDAAGVATRCGPWPS